MEVGAHNNDILGYSGTSVPIAGDVRQVGDTTAFERDGITYNVTSLVLDTDAGTNLLSLVASPAAGSRGAVGLMLVVGTLLQTVRGAPDECAPQP